MFGKAWETSPRTYGITVERGVRVPMGDGMELIADIFRPDQPGRYPALLGLSPYPLAPQTAPIQVSPLSTPLSLRPGQEKATGYVEAGDPSFFVRRGYVHVVATTRGVGGSGGTFEFLGPRQVQDGVEAIAWMAEQPWCDGNVGMFGVSYFAMIQWLIAARKPPALKCIFAPWALTDPYRDSLYHGGILGHAFWRGWIYGSAAAGQASSWTREQLGDEAYRQALAATLRDPDIANVPELVQILRNPDVGLHPILVDFLLNPTDGPFWEERRPDFSRIDVPSYIGADWAIYGIHLAGAFRNWEHTTAPRKMVIGPPAYLDRPLYQLQYESLRWFDQWLKGMDTRIMDEPPIRLFVTGRNDWKAAQEWPLPETKWTPFFLHEHGLLSERELWPNEGHDSYFDSPWGRTGVEYSTPPLVENTEVIGPIVLDLYASSTDDDAYFFVSLLEVTPDGSERILTRGWLRGSHRRVDPERSKPWLPFHPHTDPEPMVPNEVYPLRIGLVPTGNLFKAGTRIKLRISGFDDPPKHSLEMIATGHLTRVSPSRVTIYHDDEHPSMLLLPITEGNVVGTFMTGGKPFIQERP
ncbi:MAG: CocE/NonD family hydrolase [Chloroflexi bacterium]|nr:CocE/NonD family hydrolase [Chloroflexota bacterium]